MQPSESTDILSRSALVERTTRQAWLSIANMFHIINIHYLAWI